MKTNAFLVASGVIGVAVAVAAVVVVKHPLALLFGLYATSVLMLGRSLVLLAMKRPSDVQVAGRRVAGKEWLIGTCAVFAVLTCLREGCVPALAYDFTLNNATTSLDTHFNTNTNVTTTGPRTPLKAMKLKCVVSSIHGGDVGATFKRTLHCDPVSTGAEAIVEITADDAFCYFPLYASGHVAYRVRVEVFWTSATTQGSGSIDIDGTATRHQFGFGSCRSFNEAIGRTIADDTAEKVNAFLAAN